MDNPIPSVMVYFDDREKKGVICVDDNSDRQRALSPCFSGAEGDCHTHAWKPIGWASDVVFMTQRPHIRGAVSEFVHQVLSTVIRIRDDFDRMNHERDVAREENRRLRGLVMNIRVSLAEIEGAKSQRAAAKIARRTINDSYNIKEE